MEPLISVIVAVYGAEEYLERCFESILGQTYKNLELILVDDGSPGKSPQICDRYALKDNRIRVIHKKNGGAADAYNIGLDAARGEYISFIDCDDYIDISFYEILLNCIKYFNTDMVVCNYTYVDEQGIDIKEPSPIKKSELISPMEYFKRLSEPLSGYYITTWNRLYPRAIWDNLRFPIKKEYEDNRILHSIIDRCSNIYILDKKLVYYTQREKSLSRNIPKTGYYDNIEALLERINYYNTKGYYTLVGKAIEQTVELYIQLRRWYIFHAKKSILISRKTKSIFRKIKEVIKSNDKFVSKDVKLRAKHPDLTIIKDIIRERI